MKVIGFTGLPGSGKSTMIEAVKGIGKVVTMGDIIRNEARNRGLKPTDANLGKIAEELREQGGQEIVAEKCIEYIDGLKTEVIFIDGVRSMAEVRVFRSRWKFPVIAADVDRETRFNRLLERHREDDPRSIEELAERDDREIKFGVLDVIKNADYKFNNTESIEEIKKNIKDLVLRILKEY